MSIVKKFIILLVVVAAATEVLAQGSRSPFTTFGIGESYGNALIHNQGMGGIGVAQPQAWYLNNQNPALLVYNTLTVFEVGVVGESRTIKGGGATHKSKGGNMNYLAVAFPIKTFKWTTSLGLMPYSNVDYDFVNSGTSDDSVTPQEIRQTGTGGLTQLYWSNGVRITKEITVGLKAAYLFGPIDDTESLTLMKDPTTHVRFTSTVETKTSFKGFNLGGGVSFSKDSLGHNDKYRFSAGATFSLGSSLVGRTENLYYLLTQNGDTLDINKAGKYKGDYDIPGNLTIGAAWGKGTKWTVATEVAVENWSGSTFDTEDEELDLAWRGAIGGDFTPDLLGQKLLQRMTYRLGVSMEQYPWLRNGNAVKDVGINFGFSVPSGRSSIDLAFKYGKRGDQAKTDLEETYFKVFFGITFNDQWFIKRRFD
ncbi:hypothetical protein [Pseudochryseolinea flava]|uniref:Long-chain fatty acid transport protein n=1 Tax=Pseudochryseolinea flava TaxID=2059302 RepID=A0A364YBF2_9BACT|nr:hypothetical protein [Pseudochryseolinea flava]RAW03412.1 hypothetical protein DQQ10_04820 [Pseudochryseolinea flava]